MTIDDLPLAAAILASLITATTIARILAERWRWIGCAWLCSLPFIALIAAWMVVTP